MTYIFKTVILLKMYVDKHTKRHVHKMHVFKMFITAVCLIFFSHHSICIVFLIETAQKNEEKGDAEYKRNEFSNAAVFYTKGIEVNCEDVALNAVLYKKRAASHFLMGEFRPLFDFQFSNNKWRGGGLIVSALLIEWSEFEHWPETLRCVLGQDTSLSRCRSRLSLPGV